MTPNRKFETGGEILVADVEAMDVAQVDGIVWASAGVRIECQRGDVSVELDGRRVIVTLPSEGEIP